MRSKADLLTIGLMQGWVGLGGYYLVFQHRRLHLNAVACPGITHFYAFTLAISHVCFNFSSFTFFLLVREGT